MDLLKQSINQRSDDGIPLTQRVTANHTPKKGLSEIPSWQKVHKESRFVEGEMG